MAFDMGGAFTNLYKWALDAHPKIPDTPQYETIDPFGQQRRTIRGNIAALPDEALLAERTNAANLAGTQAMFGRAMPRYAQMAQLTEDALAAYLQGRSPSGVGNVMRQSNVKAFGGGYGRSGVPATLNRTAGDAIEARDLGRDADANIRYGIDAFQRYARGNPVLANTPRYAVGQSFLSPQSVIEFERRQANERAARDQIAAIRAAMPDPTNEALAGDLGEFTSLVIQMLSGYAGGGAMGAALGGMGGMGGGLGGGGKTSAPSYSPGLYETNFGYPMSTPGNTPAGYGIPKYSPNWGYIGATGY